jgi:hypothetical protein
MDFPDTARPSTSTAPVNRGEERNRGIVANDKPVGYTERLPTCASISPVILQEAETAKSCLAAFDRSDACFASMAWEPTSDSNRSAV